MINLNIIKRLIVESKTDCYVGSYLTKNSYNSIIFYFTNGSISCPIDYEGVYYEIPPGSIPSLVDTMGSLLSIQIRLNRKIYYAISLLNNEFGYELSHYKGHLIIKTDGARITLYF